MIEDWKALIAKAKIPKVIAQMLSRLEFLDDQSYSHQIIMISSRQEELKKKLAQELISEENGRIAQNKIKASILMLIEELEDDEVDLGGGKAKIETPAIDSPSSDSPITDLPSTDTPSSDLSTKEAPMHAPGVGIEVATPQEAVGISLDKLKEQASLKLRELKSLRKEETFTLPGANLFKIQLNIEELEKEMDSLKEQIRNFGSESEE